MCIRFPVFSSCLFLLIKGDSSIQIRRAKEEELQDLIKISRDEIYDEIPLKEVREWFISFGKHPYVQYFVATQNGKILGFIAWSVFDRYGNEIILALHSIAVKKRFKRRKIGKMLLEGSLEEIKRYWAKKGLTVVMYFVDTEEENEPARRFYENVMKPTYKVVISNVFQNSKAKVFYFRKLG